MQRNQISRVLIALSVGIAFAMVSGAAFAQSFKSVNENPTFTYSTGYKSPKRMDADWAFKEQRKKAKKAAKVKKGKQPTPGVPEPTAALLFAAGFGAVGMAARRRTRR